MNKSLLLFLAFFFSLSKLLGQSSTNSTGSGNFNATGTWVNAANLSGTANILNGHTVTVPTGTTVYANKITFSGTGKMLLSSSTSKWVPATNKNASPTLVSPSPATNTNWEPSTVWAGDAYNASHYTPWINSVQGWSAANNNYTDYLILILDNPTWVQGIQTQGRANSAQWVTSAKIEVSADKINWVTILSNATLNSDMNTKVNTTFPNVVWAKYIKVTPAGIYAHTSMRMGALLR